MWRILLAGWFSWMALATRSPLFAQEGGAAPDDWIVANEAKVDFPDEVTFRLEWASTIPIVDAVLTYDVDRASCLEAATQVPVEVRGPVIEWTWVMIRSGNPPPGSRLWWEWNLTSADGTRFTSPRQEITLSDDRFEWRTVAAPGIRLHWYRGDEVGQTLLDAAVAGLERLQTEMGIQLQNGVQLFIYGSSNDMRDAVLYIQDWAGGVAFSEYNVILIGVPPTIAEDWGRSTVRHELAHLVVEQFGRSCVGGSRPTWLNEGLAVYAEGPLQADFAHALESALGENSFRPVRSLNGAFPSHEEQAGIAYAQSYSLVAYLLEEYGQEKMQELLLTLAQGEGYDRALERVYGFNEDGLEVAWRNMIGAPARDIPPTPTSISAAQIPTIVPAGAPNDMPTPPAAAEPPPQVSPSSPGLCNLGMIPLFLLGAIAYGSRGKGERKRRC
jgi:hypothetical protein